MCLLWGAGDTAGETPGCAIPGCRKHPPPFPTPLLCRPTSQREPAAVPLQPQRASPRAEETFFARRNTVPAPRPATAGRHCGGGGGNGGRERGARREKGARGQPHRQHPAPGRQLLPTEDMHMDAGHMDAGEDPHRRATGPRGRQPGLGPGGRGLQGEGRGRAGKGRERSHPAG